MKKSSLIIDTLLTFAATYLLGAVIVGYFTRDKAAVIVSALTFGLAATFFTGKLHVRRAKPTAKKKKLEGILDKFVFSPPEYAYDFALKAISSRHKATETDGFIVSGNTAFKVDIVPEKISCATLALAYAAAAKLGAKRLVILSGKGAQTDADETAKLLSAPLTEIWDFDKVYDFFSSLGSPPTETLVLAPRKRRFGAALGESLDRRNARKYLFTAIVTLIFARFMPYPVLYVSIASVCVVLAILSRIEIVRFFKRIRR